MDLFRKRCVRVTIPGLDDEEIYLRKPSAALMRRLSCIQADGSLIEAERPIMVMAEAIASCLVDAAGVPRLESAQQALDELDVDAFVAVANRIFESFTKAPKVEDLEKNSETAPISTSPTV